MRKFFLPLLPVAFVLFATGCSTKFDVAAPYKNITVVYGLLDQKDTAHYVRIQKAFMDQNKSAITMAKESDSSFFKTISVRIERYDFNNNYYDSFHLYRVDMGSEGYPKEPGAFFTAPNYAYKFKNPLDPKYIYRIKVTNFATGEVDSSDAPIIADNPVPFGFHPPLFVYVLDDSSGNRAGLDFANSGSYAFAEIQGRYVPEDQFSFNGATSPAAFAQAIIRFNWIDSNVVTHTRTAQYYDYDAGYITLAGNAFDYKITDQSLYGAISAAMKETPNIQRYLDRCDVTVYMGTQDFANYLAANQTQGTGLTGSEIEPVFTNIKGANAIGLYTSRGSHTGKLTITRNTIDSLKTNSLTVHANIQGTVY